jgi:hypothetical protein
MPKRGVLAFGTTPNTQHTNYNTLPAPHRPVRPPGNSMASCGKPPAARRTSQWISGSVAEGSPTEEPRPDASNARSQRPATRAIGVSRALACVLNTRGCPQVFYTAPVIHPVPVHKYPWQAS